jgi:hypothetical protein
MPAALLVAAWELSLGVWLVVKGFKPASLTTGIAATDRASASSAASYSPVTEGIPR